LADNNYMTRRPIIILLTFLLFVACGTKPSIGPPAKGQPLTKEERRAIIQTARHYLDTPYRFNGIGADGFDCSGFVYSVYLEAIHLQLPRSTNELYKCTRPINLKNAKPGDLVFFAIRSGGRPDHAGVFMENFDFIHSSKSRGVIISTLDDIFYRQKLLSVRRLRSELIVGDNGR